MRNPAPLLRPGELTEDQVRDMLAPVEFVDWKTAHRRLLDFCVDDAHRDALTTTLPMLLSALQAAATPDQSLLNLERLMQSVDDSLELLQFLADNPRGVEILVKLFVNSQFLTEILLRHPDWLRQLTQHKRIAEFKSREQFRDDAQATVQVGREVSEQLDLLRKFQQGELLRIGACDNFGLMDLKSITLQLSLLADAIVQTALALLATSSGVSLDGFVVLAMGKLGGEELNYSSDIDLVFVSRQDATQYWELGQQLIRGVMDSTAEGFLYRVDMRLRPWGRSGALVTSQDGYVDYLRQHGGLWEKQALLKARPIAGNLDVGHEFLQRVEPLIFEVPIDKVRENVRVMKGRIEADLKKQGRVYGEVKSGKGSIRDVEFVTQYLQIRHGRTEKHVRSFNTLDGLVRLADFELILPTEFRQLSTAYVFLRKIEHSLQLLHYRQAHSLPSDERELAYLARRLDFPNAKAFLQSYERHCSEVRLIYERFIEARESDVGPVDTAAPAPPRPGHAELMSPAYSKVFSEADLKRHECLLEQIDPQHPVVLESVGAPEGCVQLTVCGVDQRGDLAMMCGLLFAYGFNILHGQVFTARQVLHAQTEASHDPTMQPFDERRFVNVFTLTPPDSLRNGNDDIWTRYLQELERLFWLAGEGSLAEAQGRVARRVADVLHERPNAPPLLGPMDVEIDNAKSNTLTVLHISAEDTPGFLYELTNSLSLLGYDIRRVMLTSLGNRAVDTLFIVGPGGEKITDPAQQTRLRTTVVLVKHFMQLLPGSPDPARALLHFSQFLEQLFELPDWSDKLASLDRSVVLEALSLLLGVSDFLWEDFLRVQHDNLFPIIRDIDGLADSRPRSEIDAELTCLIAESDSAEECRQRINAFKDREMFRVDMRHIAGHIVEFGQFSAELTDVAECVVNAALDVCRHELVDRYGTPRTKFGDQSTEDRLAVLALGKAGGRELGFASDIELMFVYAGSGQTDGPCPIATAEFYIKLVEAFTHTIQARRRGVFEIDLRLRPFGNAGPLAVSLSAFEAYFALTGPAWPYERQALVKMRPIAGDPQFGRHLVELRDRLVYTGEPFDVAAMRGLREQQVRQLVQPGTWNAKLSAGGLVDCEYLVQALQISHGQNQQSIRLTNTRQAIRALHEAGFLSDEQSDRLRRAHMFLRRLIDALRIVRGDARDLTVPDPATEEFEFLARRLGYGMRLSELSQNIESTAADVTDLSRLLDGPK
jgi:glutamate-ammonia-ligase adenylyltransferase